MAVGPLLVASQTHDPFLVSLALFSEYLPTLVFGLVGGVIADRVNRRQMVVVANVGRALVLAVLVATILTGTVSIAVILLALLAMGTAEVFADSASSTLIPSLVARADLGIANARMQGAFVLTNQLLKSHPQHCGRDRSAWHSVPESEWMPIFMAILDRTEAQIRETTQLLVRLHTEKKPPNTVRGGGNPRPTMERRFMPTRSRLLQQRHKRRRPQDRANL